MIHPRQTTRSNYVDRLYKCKTPEEIQFVLCYGMKNGFLDETDIVHIYVDAECRSVDEDIQVADWIMTELDPIIAKPGPVCLPVIV
jgi:hypothetical protein